MNKNCVKCGKKQLPYHFNYSGFDCCSTKAPFPNRISPQTISGNRQQDFLCATCVNKYYELECKQHGKLDGKFDKGNPPICSKCKYELSLLKDLKVPDTFKCVIALDYLKFNDINIDKSFAAISLNNNIHFISDRSLHCEPRENFDFRIEPSLHGLKLQIRPIKYSPVKFAIINIETLNDLDKSNGWIEFWFPQILDMEHRESPITFCYLSYSMPNQNDFVNKLIKRNVALISLKNDNIVSYPSIKFPEHENLFSWKNKSDSTNNHIELYYKVQNIPHKIVFGNLKRHDYNNFFSKIVAWLPSEIKINDITDSYEEQLCITNIKVYPQKADVRALLKLNNETIEVQSVLGNDFFRVQFTHGFIYKTFFLACNDNMQYCFGSLTNDACKEIHKRLKPMYELTMSAKVEHVYLFLDRNLSNAHNVVLLDHGISFDNKITVDYQAIIDISSKLDENNGFNLSIKFITDNISKSLQCLLPRDYGYKLWEEIELKKTEATFNNISPGELYENYNNLKRSNVLIGIFSNLILLNQSLDENITMAELQKQVALCDSEGFFKNKKLYNEVINKVILFGISIQEIKIHFEYLASYGPYCQYQNEIAIIEKTFGENISRKIMAVERRQIVNANKNIIRQVQASIQRIFGEIERGLGPINPILQNREIKKKIADYITQYFPQASQAVLYGTIMTMGTASGAVGIIAGMLGIKTMQDFLSDIRKNKENAAKIKHSFENICIWWQTLKDTLPVILYEASDAIDIENERCLKRDTQLLNLLPPEERNISLMRLKSQLCDQVLLCTSNRFHEIVEGSGKRYKSFATEIETTINHRFQGQFNGSIGMLSLSNNNLKSTLQKE